MWNVYDGVEYHGIAFAIKSEIGKVVDEPFKYVTPRFMVYYGGYCFRGYTPFEVWVAQFVATSIIPESNGKIVLVTTFVVYFQALSFSYN